MNNNLINTIYNEESMYTPIWLMRQAGRYLPEYRAIRSKAGSFLNLCKHPEMACEVTLQPLKRFNLDAAILFSDILVIPDAMGLKLDFIESQGPKFAKPIRTLADINALNTTNIINNLEYVFKTIKNIQVELKNKIPLIGFSGSPFTLACYMIEGGSSKDYMHTKQMLINNPENLHLLLDKITQAVIAYLNMQIQSGVDIVMLFDSWGGVLTENAYLEFSLKYLQKIINCLTKTNNNKKIPNIIFTKGGGAWLEHITKTNTNTIGLDWTINIAKAKTIVKDVTLQGNLDPVILAVGDKNAIKKEVTKILNDYLTVNDGNPKGHIFNLGHGILPITNPDNVAFLVDTVHELSQK